MNNSRIDIHENLCNELHDLYVSKNEDYGDSFRKVRNKFPTAILVRLHDKLNRLESLLGKDEDERKVKDESIDDTLMDIANYALLELVERRWDGEEDEEDEEDGDEDEEDDDDLTSSECIKRMSRRSAEWYNKFIRSNTFDHPNYAHYEVFGSFNDNNTARITVVRFYDNGEITGFKEEFQNTYFGKLKVDFYKHLITDPKMLAVNKIYYHNVRNSVWNLMDRKRFQWIIVPNDDGFSYTFHSYIFDENNNLVKGVLNPSVFMDINRPMIILDVKRMFEKENEEDENNDFVKNHVNYYNEVFEIKGIRQKSSNLPYGVVEEDVEEEKEDCWSINTAIENVKSKLQSFHDSIVMSNRLWFIKVPNFEHIEVVGKRINNYEFIVYIIHFAKDWKITGFKMESIPVNTGIIRLDINSNLIKDERMLNNIWYRKTRDSLFEPDGKDSFEWFIIPENHGQDEYLKFYKYYFDTTGSLIKFKSEVKDKHIIENPIYFYIDQIFDNDSEEDEYVEED